MLCRSTNIYKSFNNVKRVLSQGLIDFVSALHTDSKKTKNEPSLVDLQNNIVRILTEKNYERADGLGGKNH